MSVENLKMAEDIDNDDQWLYGENDEISQSNLPPNTENELQPEEELKDVNPPPPLIPPADDGPPGVDQEPDEPKESNEEEGEDGELKQNGEGSEKEDLDDEDDDSDDGVNVVIGEVKTSPTYSSLNIKRGGLLTSTAAADKGKQQQQQTGKFSVEEFDQPGMINGVPATEFNLDSLEEKPWRKPGADITDYFNYGFNEDTWKAYCERQKRLRMTESGVGLASMNAIGLPRGPMMPIMNDNSKYSGNFLANRKAGPPPGRRTTGTIDVIVGSTQQRIGATGAVKSEPPKENVIQVMTADRREYSRKPPGFPDMSVPPPTAFDEFQPDYGFNPEPEPYYGGYEPTQDVQWGGEAPSSGWVPSADVKSLTPGPQPMGPPPHMMGPPMPGHMRHSPSRDSPHKRDRDRDRDRESRSRSEKPRARDRERERSHRRDRSRSRSRRHKSRSRSPSHRSHRKKKSKRHDDSE